MITASKTLASDAEARNQTASTALQIRRAEPRFYQDQPQPEFYLPQTCSLTGTSWEASDWPLSGKATELWLFFFWRRLCLPSPGAIVTPLC